MTAITDKANLEFRDMEAPGSATPHEPEKPGIRELFAVIDIALGSLGVNGAITVKKATRALLFADLAHNPDTLAVVYNDPTDGYNGIYSKSGVSGSGTWSLTGLALPATFSAELAEVIAKVQGIEDAVEVATEAAGDAAGSALATVIAKDAAEDARDAALALVPVGAATGTQPTKAALDAAVAGLANGGWLVIEDETNEGAPALYTVQSGALVGNPAVFKRRDALLPPSPQDEGGADDGALDNRLPFEAVIGGLSGTLTIRVPSVEGGDYYFGDFTNDGSYTEGLTFDVDRGVIFTAPLGKWLAQSDMRVTKPLRFDVVTGGAGDYQFTLGPAANRTAVEKERYLDHGSADWSVTRNIDCATEVTPWEAYPPSTLQAGSFADSGAAFVEFDTDANYLEAGTVVCRPGEEVHFAPTDLATLGPFGFLVILKGGFLLTYQEQGLSAAISWRNSVTAEDGGITYRGYALHNSYNAAKSVMGIRVLGPRTFQILHNGYAIHTFWDTGADILEVGGGAGINTTAGSFRLTNWTRTTGKKLANQKPQVGLVVGDSRVDPGVMGHWDMFLKEAADGAGGMRIVSLTNVAVSGNNTAAQTAAVAALGSLAAYTFACVDVGTNDIQGNVPLSTSVGAFTDLLDLLDGLMVTVAIPALWYGRAQTPGGNKGTDSLRYDEGAALRQAYKAICAERPNVKVFEYDELGPILSDWLTGYPDLTMAPMVFDNIHPDFVARRLMGYAHAKALLGLLSPEPVKTYPIGAFASTWFAGSYTGRASFAPSYEIDAVGRATLSGWLDVTGSLPAAGTTLATLPKMLRPARNVTRVCPCYDNAGTPVSTGYCAITVTPAGVIKNDAAFPASTRYFQLDPLDYNLP